MRALPVTGGALIVSGSRTPVLSRSGGLLSLLATALTLARVSGMKRICLGLALAGSLTMLAGCSSTPAADTCVTIDGGLQVIDGAFDDVNVGETADQLADRRDEAREGVGVVRSAGLEVADEYADAYVAWLDEGEFVASGAGSKAALDQAMEDMLKQRALLMLHCS